MAIARVRIAPVERWCFQPGHGQLTKEQCLSLQGREVGIITTTCRPCTTPPLCDGREWQVEPRSGREILDSIGLPKEAANAWWPCEHMLEMD
jgi:hypothetical protein